MRPSSTPPDEFIAARRRLADLDLSVALERAERARDRMTVQR